VKLKLNCQQNLLSNQSNQKPFGKIEKNISIKNISSDFWEQLQLAAIASTR